MELQYKENWNSSVKIEKDYKCSPRILSVAVPMPQSGGIVAQPSEYCDTMPTMSGD